MIYPSYAAAPARAAYLPYYYHHDNRLPFSAEEYRSNWLPKVSFTGATFLWRKDVFNNKLQVKLLNFVNAHKNQDLL